MGGEGGREVGGNGFANLSKDLRLYNTCIRYITIVSLLIYTDANEH